MEYGTVQSDLVGSEIIPTQPLANYRGLVAKYNQLLPQQNKVQLQACPCCGTQKFKAKFDRLNSTYSECQECFTLFVAERPNTDTLKDFYTNSTARNYWLNQIYRKTAGPRQEKLAEPLCHWIDTFLAETFAGKTLRIAEFGASHWAVAMSWAKLKLSGTFSFFDPYFPRAQAPEHLNYSRSTDKFEAVCLFDALGRVENPSQLLLQAYNSLEEGGLCFVTTPLSTGFDMYLLGKSSEALIPPDKLTLPSFEGILKLVSATPFEVIEFSTPGVLDVEIVKEAWKTNPSSVPEFFSYIFGVRKDENLLKSFQDFLQVNRLSSRGRLVLKKGKA